MLRNTLEKFFVKKGLKLIASFRV